MKGMEGRHAACQVCALLTLIAICSVAARTAGAQVRVESVLAPPPVDVLFVIDNSDSMLEAQVSLAQSFPRFMAVLDGTPQGRPDVHVGVVSADVGIAPFGAEHCDGAGDDGVLQNSPRLQHCATPVEGARFIEDVTDALGGRRTNYDGDIADVFACVSRLGNDGCAMQQPLEAMLRALGPPNVANAGFLRPDAILAVIFLANEDDCSAYNPDLFDTDARRDHPDSDLGPFATYRCTEAGVACDGLAVLPRSAGEYVQCRSRQDSPYLRDPREVAAWLASLKGGAQHVIVAVIAGNPAPFTVSVAESTGVRLDASCSGSAGLADPGVRLAAFAAEFGSWGSTLSFCQPAGFDLVMEEAARMILSRLKMPGPIGR